MMAGIPGWYMDAMEQNLGILIDSARRADLSVEFLAQHLADPAFADDSGQVLDPQEHVGTLALCLAIAIRRLARVDMPA